MDSGESPGELGENVGFPLEHHPARSIGTSNQALADLKASRPQRVCGDGDLVLRTHSRRAPAPILYITHECKEKVLDSGLATSHTRCMRAAGNPIELHHCHFYTVVEVMGRYSNHKSNLLGRVASLEAGAPDIAAR
ncbi:MAG: hypothetical protein FJW94_14695 [Actinobacteria bacterium]|nr:hypothetical protein [Actinomycetota bacterium]